MGRFDTILHWLVLLLTLIGLVEIFSAYSIPRIVYYSVYYPENISAIFKSLKPIIFTLFIYLVGFGIYFFLIKTESKKLNRLFLGKNILYLTIFTLILMFVVVVERFVFHMHANRWLIGPKHTILITGLVILTTFLFLAYQLSKKSIDWFKVFFYLILIEFLLILQPDTGTFLLILFGFLTILFFKKRNKWIQGAYIFFTSLFVFVSLFIILVSKLSLQIPNFLEGTLFSHLIDRINNYLDPFSDVTARSYQIANSLYAVHRGGFDGVGYGFGMRKIYMGPTVHTDFIFATIGEEMGFLFAIFIFVITLLLLLRLINLAYRFKGEFERYFTILVTVETFSMAIINAGMAVNLLPSKGWPYPLISYAPFFVLFYIIQLGIIQYFVRKRFYEVF